VYGWFGIYNDYRVCEAARPSPWLSFGSLGGTWLMTAILATGGLDDVAMAVGEAIVLGILFIIGCFMAFSWWKRSLIAAAIACLLVLTDGAFFQPWTVIAPTPAPDAYDAYWIFRLRVISVLWLLFGIGAVVCLVRAIRHRKQRRDGHVAT
jgi:hypothetical protein